MPAMFPRSVSVEQAGEKNLGEVYYFSTNIFDTTFGKGTKGALSRGQTWTKCYCLFVASTEVYLSKERHSIALSGLPCFS